MGINTISEMNKIIIYKIGKIQEILKIKKVI